VEKIRKIGQWVWLNKERMVFLVMVIILCWRVYIVVKPPVPVDDVNPPQPSAQRQMDVPPLPPTPDPRVTPPPTAPLKRVDPFWYWSSQVGEDTGEEGDLGIELESILPTPTGPMARLKTKGGRARAYREGEQFENYIVRRIDADAGEVEVYDESTGNDVILRTR
jgi:hypothetical protein